MTNVAIVIGLVAVVLGVLWPANARRWGDDQAPPAVRPDPVWEPWDYAEAAPLHLPERPAPLSTYRVGEIIETSAPRRIGAG